MTKITLTTNNPTPKQFQPSQGDVFQVDDCGTTILVMVTSDDNVVELTGANNGYIGDLADYNISSETLVAKLELAATLTATV